MDFWDDELRKAVHAVIPAAEGQPGVNVGAYDGGVYVCRRISGLHTDEDSFNGQCEWVDPEDARPGELTDGMAISCDCVRLGPGWWLDTYFGWYFVYDPQLVARSLAGDHGWVRSFLDSNKGPEAERSLAPIPAGLADRLVPPEAQSHLKTEDVVRRLRGEFTFFAAHPHQGGDVAGRTEPDESPAGRDCTYSAVVADDPASMDYLSFDVRSGEAIVIGYRDEQHRAAVRGLVERCARLLGYHISLQ